MLRAWNMLTEHYPQATGDWAKDSQPKPETDTANQYVRAADIEAILKKYRTEMHEIFTHELKKPTYLEQSKAQRRANR